MLGVSICYRRQAAEVSGPSGLGSLEVIAFDFRFLLLVYGKGGGLDISSYSLGGQAWQRQ